MPLISNNHPLLQKHTEPALNLPTPSEIEYHFAKAARFIRLHEMSNLAALLESLDYIPFSRMPHIATQGPPLKEALLQKQPNGSIDPNEQDSPDLLRSKEALNIRMGNLITVSLLSKNYEALELLLEKSLGIIESNVHTNFQKKKRSYEHIQYQKSITPKGQSFSIPYEWDIDPQTITEEAFQRDLFYAKEEFLFRSLCTSYNNASGLFFTIDKLQHDAGVLQQIFALDDAKALATILSNEHTSSVIEWSRSNAERSNHSLWFNACGAKALDCLHLLLEHSIFYEKEFNGSIYFSKDASQTPFSILLLVAPDKILRNAAYSARYEALKQASVKYEHLLEAVIAKAPLDWNLGNAKEGDARTACLTYFQKMQASWINTVLSSTLSPHLIEKSVLQLAAKGHHIGTPNSLSYEAEECLKKGLLDEARALKEAYELRQTISATRTPAMRSRL